MNHKINSLLLAAISCLLILNGSARAQGTAFTYQGKLNSGTNAANGNYDVRFALYPDSSSSTLSAGPVTNLTVSVTNGLFTTVVAFNYSFPEGTNWLELAVSPSGSNSFVTLTPRQQLTPVPYAVTAANLSGTVSPAQLPPEVVTNNANALSLSGTFTGNGGGLTNLTGVALLNNNNVFTAGINAFNGRLGIGTTTPNSPLAVNGNIFFGTERNNSVFNQVGDTLYLGAEQKYLGNTLLTPIGGSTDWINLMANRLSAGIMLGASGSSLSDPHSNITSVVVIKPNGNVGIDTATPQVALDVVGNINTTGAVSINTNNPNGAALAVNGNATVNGNFVGGYSGNFISNGITGGFIGGGGDPGNPNIVGGIDASILGGRANVASGPYSVAIGDTTTASSFDSVSIGNSTIASAPGSMAMGNNAIAAHPGAFVWEDAATSDHFSSTAQNQFLIRAGGGVGINTNNPGTNALVVNGSAQIIGGLSLGNGTISGNGSGLTSVNAAALTGSVPSGTLTSVPAASLTGTINNARLSGVALTAGGNSFTGNQTVNGTVAATTFSGSGTSLTGVPLLASTNIFSGASNIFSGNVFLNSAVSAVTFDVAGAAHFRQGLGVGTIATHGALEVGSDSGSFTYTTDNYGFSSAGHPGPFGAGTTPSAIYANGSIVTTETFLAISDERVKNIIGRSDAARDLNTLKSIEITDYRYKDVAEHGNASFKKVIAQQVERVFPQAVTKHAGEVPDIYEPATCKDGWIQLATNLKKGERVKLIADGAAGIYEVLEVKDGAFRSDFKSTAEKVFVYGRQVNDFRTVDYDAIAMLNVSATQELARRLEEKAAEVETLKQELADLKNTVHQLAETMTENKPTARSAELAHLGKVAPETPATASLER